jgi:cell division protein FtsQ
MRRLAVLFAAVAAVGAATLALRFGDRWPQIVALTRNGMDTLLDLSALAGLRLEALTVEGRVNTHPEDVLAALDVERGTPILSIDVAEAREAIESLPWVKSARIERQLPDAVHIVLEERTAYALWQRGSRYTLIDAEGHAIADVPGQVGELPLVVGADAPAHAFALFEALKAAPEVGTRVKAAVRIGGRRWNLHVDSYEDGLTVRLPESGLAEAIARLAALQREHAILERDIAAVDLRLPDRLVVQLTAPPAAKAATPALPPSAVKSAKNNI